ncbi:MAG TPA: outer membrane lipoprotein-sorting protein [Lacunisphaera sp.]|nr:outer membrane lipoprotein-sorting protein [Lacunisphaera sp.]
MKPNPELRSPVRRALLFALAACAAVSGWAQADRFGQPTDRAAPGKANQQEGARILSEFRQAGIAGDYWLSFTLRVMPRKGSERTVTGTLCGSRMERGPVARVEIGRERWLIESGPSGGAWKWDAGGLAALAPAEVGQTLAGTGVTVFDLQMPFLHWKDFTYEGEARVRGRASHSFILRPPADAPRPTPEMTGVRVLIDTQFQAMVQAELLGSGQVVEKTISLLDLKKVGEQWILKSIDVRNARTRDKTRFTVTAAALDLQWPDGTFAAENLSRENPPVSTDRIVSF